MRKILTALLALIAVVAFVQFADATGQNIDQSGSNFINNTNNVGADANSKSNANSGANVNVSNKSVHGIGGPGAPGLAHCHWAVWVNAFYFGFGYAEMESICKDFMTLEQIRASKREGSVTCDSAHGAETHRLNVMMRRADAGFLGFLGSRGPELVAAPCVRTPPPSARRMVYRKVRPGVTCGQLRAKYPQCFPTAAMSMLRLELAEGESPMKGDIVIGEDITRNVVPAAYTPSATPNASTPASGIPRCGNTSLQANYDAWKSGRCSLN